MYGGTWTLVVCVYIHIYIYTHTHHDDRKLVMQGLEK